MQASYVYALVGFVVVLLGIGMYLWLRKAIIPSGPLRGVFLLGAAGTSSPFSVSANTAANAPFTSGDETKDALLANVMTHLRTIDPSAAVATVPQIAAAIAPANTLPLNVTGYFANARVVNGVEHTLTINEGITGDYISEAPAQAYNLAFVFSAMPSDDWVLANLIPLGVTISTGPNNATDYVPSA